MVVDLAEGVASVSRTASRVGINVVPRGYGAVVDVSSASLYAFVDESSCVRTSTLQEYLIGAAIIAADDCEAIREVLRPLRLPRQIKPHWTDENPRRRRQITEAISSLGSMYALVTHTGARSRKTERYRRKCLETLYFELETAGVRDVTLERRSDGQDKQDRAHVVALQGQGLYPGLRISHRRGGDDPLLWIPDALLGAVNASIAGEHQYLELLRDGLVIVRKTLDSWNPG